MADTEPRELTIGADGFFATDLSDGLAAAVASIGTGSVDKGDLTLSEPQFPHRNLTTPHQSMTAA
jgi:hypothetical protein